MKHARGGQSPPSLRRSLSSIVTRLDVDQFSVLKGQIIQQACRPKIVGPNALLHRPEDVDRGLAYRVIGALMEVFHHVVDRGGLSAPFFYLLGADHDDPTVAVKRQRASDRYDQDHDRQHTRHHNHSPHRPRAPRAGH